MESVEPKIQVESLNFKIVGFRKDGAEGEI